MRLKFLGLLLSREPSRVILVTLWFDFDSRENIIEPLIALLYFGGLRWIAIQLAKKLQLRTQYL